MSKNIYRTVFIGHGWSMTVFTQIDPEHIESLPLNGTVTDGLLIDGMVAFRADKQIKDQCGVGPAEFATDVEVEHWAHAKA